MDITYGKAFHIYTREDPAPPPPPPSIQSAKLGAPAAVGGGAGAPTEPGRLGTLKQSLSLPPEPSLPPASKTDRTLLF